MNFFALGYIINIMIIYLKDSRWQHPGGMIKSRDSYSHLYLKKDMYNYPLNMKMQVSYLEQLGMILHFYLIFW